MYLYNLFVFECGNSNMCMCMCICIFCFIPVCMIYLIMYVIYIYLTFGLLLLPPIVSGQTHPIAILWVPSFELVCSSSSGLAFTSVDMWESCVGGAEGRSCVGELRGTASGAVWG